jgi:hypothetical protein
VRQSKNAQQRHLFVVCFFGDAQQREPKKLVSPSVLTGLTGVEKKIVVRYRKMHGKLKGLPCVPQKTHGKLFFTVRFLFAVRPV